MLQLTNISKRYSNKEEYVLKNIDLNFDDKGMVCLLGKSGSGKSTLLNIIGLLDNDYEGDVIFNGVNIKNLKKYEQDYYHKNIVGLIFQHYHLLNNYTVKDNILINSKNKNIDEILDTVGLIGKKNTLVSKLSGGEKQRVAIARALINDPSIILADEPTGALDSVNSKTIMELLKNISKSRLVIVVTHNEEDALLYADKIIRISDGVIELDQEINTKNNNKIKFSKNRYSFINEIKLALNNIINKKNRFLLTTISFSIGIASLLIVLSIAHGFNKSIELEEKGSLSKQPIYISKTSINLDDKFNKINDIEEESDVIHSINDTSLNIIDDNYLKYLNDYSNIKYKIYSYFNGDFLYYGNSNNEIYHEFKLLAGNKPNKENECILLVDNTKVINNRILKQLKIEKEEINYEDLVNKYVVINNEKYNIKGIYLIDKESPFAYFTGILLNKTLNTIPEEIYLYANNYQDKQKLKEYLSNYPNDYVGYTDYASTLKTVTKTLINGISAILIAFSFISLFVCAITLGIITFISVIERIKEIGILKSVGLSYRVIKNIFYLENIFIAIVSFINALILTINIGNIFNKVIFNLIGLENVFVLSINNVIIVLFLSITIVILSSILPLKKIKKINIIDTLTYE